MSSLGSGERMVARLVLSGKERGWAEQYMANAMSGVGSANQLAYDATRSRKSPKGEGGSAPVGLIPLAVFAMVGLNVYNSWSEGDVMKAVLIGCGALVASAAGEYVYFKFLKPKKAVYLDPRLVERRVSGSVFDAEVKLHVFQWPGGGESRAPAILDDVVSAYVHYGNPLGSRFSIGEIAENDRDQMGSLAMLESIEELIPTGLGAFKTVFGSPESSVMGSLEAASLWHPPSSEDDVQSMERMTAGRLIPRYHKVTDGAFVGTDKNDDPVLLPDEALKSHHFYVARTRMGKSAP